MSLTKLDSEIMCSTRDKTESYIMPSSKQSRETFNNKYQVLINNIRNIQLRQALQSARYKMSLAELTRIINSLGFVYPKQVRHLSNNDSISSGHEILKTISLILNMQSDLKQIIRQDTIVRQNYSASRIQNVYISSRHINEEKSFIADVGHMIFECRPEVMSLMFFEGYRSTFESYTEATKAEKGYFNAMRNTFRSYMNIDYLSRGRVLSCDDILRIHGECLANNIDIQPIQKGRFTQGAEFGLFPTLYLKQEIPAFTLALERLSTHEDIGFNFVIGFGAGQVKAQNNASDNNSAVQNILTSYQNDSKRNRLEILSSLVRCIQRLILLHPFADGNSRTFCMMILNLELLKHNMYPSLQTNPNDFDLYDIPTLVAKIKIGQARFIAFCKGLQIHYHESFDCIKSKEIYSSLRDYKASPTSHVFKRFSKDMAFPSLRNWIKHNEHLRELIDEGYNTSR